MKWYIDFSGYCEIEASTREEAEKKFWEGLRSPSSEAYNDVYDIDGIEEKGPDRFEAACNLVRYIDGLLQKH